MLMLSFSLLYDLSGAAVFLRLTLSMSSRLRVFLVCATASSQSLEYLESTAETERHANIDIPRAADWYWTTDPPRVKPERHQVVEEFRVQVDGLVHFDVVRACPRFHSF